MRGMLKCFAVLLALLLPLGAPARAYWEDAGQELFCDEGLAGCHVLQMVMTGSFAGMDEQDSLSVRMHAAALPWLRAVAQEDFDHFCARFGENEDDVRRCWLVALGYALWADILVHPGAESVSEAQARQVLLLFLNPDNRRTRLEEMAAIRSQMDDGAVAAIAAAAQVPAELVDRLVFSEDWREMQSVE